jgi:Fe-S oxidoreductase
VTYHDPSYLGRYGDDCYEVPRQLIRDVLRSELREMTYARRRALPAGPHLGFPFTEDAIEIGKRRVAEALATGASVLLTASPFDYFNLSRASVGALQVLYLPCLVCLQSADRA